MLSKIVCFNYRLMDGWGNGLYSWVDRKETWITQIFDYAQINKFIFIHGVTSENIAALYYLVWVSTELNFKSTSVCYHGDFNDTSAHKT